MPNNNDTTTSFKADISELKKAMQEAKRSVAVANSEFKAVSSTMDDWTKSSDGVSAKLKQLDSNLKSQDKILESLEEQYRLTVKEMGEGSKAADDLRIKINNQKAVINSTKREIDKYNKTLAEVKEEEDKVAKGGKDVADALDEMGDSAKNSGDGFTVFKGAIAGFAGNMLTGLVSAVGEGISSIVSLADETREYRTELGKLETAFTTAGFSTETATNTYKDFYAVLGDEGQSVEAVNHLSQLAQSEEDLAKWTEICTGVYGTFGASLPIENLTEASNETAKTGQITGGLADALNWAGASEEEFQAQLDACSSEQERQALITETLNGLYSEAAENYKEVNGDIMDAQRAQSELTDATANLGAVAEPVMTSFKLLGASLLNDLLPSVTDLGGGFTDLMNGVEGADKRIGTAVGDLVNTVLGKITELLPNLVGVGLSLVVSLIQGILSALPQLVTTVIEMAGSILETLSTAIPQLALAIIDAVPKIIDALMSMLPTFITACIDFLMAIVEALPTVVTALVSALPTIITSIINGLMNGVDALITGAVALLMAIVDAIPQILPVLIQALPQIINALVTGLYTMQATLIQGAIQLLLGILQAIPVLVTELFNAVPDIIMALIEGLVSAQPMIWQTAVDLFMYIVKAIPEIVKALFVRVPSIYEVIYTVLLRLIPLLVSLFSTVMDKVGTWIKNFAQKGGEGAKNFLNKVVEFVKQLPSKVWTWLVNVVTKVLEWRANMINKAGEVATGFINKVIEYVKQLPAKVWTWLVEVVTKVLEWRANLIAKGKEVAQDLVETIVNKIKELPDKMLSIGADLVKGLWNGINDTGAWLKDKISGFVGNVTDWLKDFFGIGSPSKLMADEVGKWLPSGIAVGIDKNAKSVMESMRDVAVGAVSGARAGLTTDSVSAGGTVGTIGGGVVNNFTQINNSPKALSRLEIYRQTTNLLGFAGGM